MMLSKRFRSIQSALYGGRNPAARDNSDALSDEDGLTTTATAKSLHQLYKARQYFKWAIDYRTLAEDALCSLSRAFDALHVFDL